MTLNASLYSQRLRSFNRKTSKRLFFTSISSYTHDSKFSIEKKDDFDYDKMTRTKMKIKTRIKTCKAINLSHALMPKF